MREDYADCWQGMPTKWLNYLSMMALAQLPLPFEEK